MPITFEYWSICSERKMSALGYVKFLRILINFNCNAIPSTAHIWKFVDIPCNFNIFYTLLNIFSLLLQLKLKYISEDRDQKINTFISLNTFIEIIDCIGEKRISR